MSATDWAVVGLIGGLVVLSSFDLTAKLALYLAIFLCVIAWMSVYKIAKNNGGN